MGITNQSVTFSAGDVASGSRWYHWLRQATNTGPGKRRQGNGSCSAPLSSLAQMSSMVPFAKTRKMCAAKMMNTHQPLQEPSLPKRSTKSVRIFPPTAFSKNAFRTHLAAMFRRALAAGTAQKPLPDPVGSIPHRSSALARVRTVHTPREASTGHVEEAVDTYPFYTGPAGSSCGMSCCSLHLSS